MEEKLRRQIRNWTLFMMGITILIGISTFPIETELAWLNERSASLSQPLAMWIEKVYAGVKEVNSTYPFLAYGTDWLAFAHLIIGMLFVGVLRDPVRNKWVIDWSVACCILVFPLAFIAGPIRGIPFFHQLIDCSFGLFGLIPILIVRYKIKALERILMS